ncbi:MAG: sulfotransferase family 2 domain-containing protein [Paracoccaceae bacterium]
MVFVLPRQGIAYFPVRKAATTSVNAALRKLVAPGDPTRKTTRTSMSARQRRLAKGCFKFTVVRDPVSRLLSCYGNRVEYHKDLSATFLDRTLVRAIGRDPHPDADTFFQNLRAYCMINDKIWRHTRLQRLVIGTDLGFFDAIYRISELDKLASDLSARVGQDIVFERLQTGGPKTRFEDLSRASQESVLRFTAPDYRLLHDFFTPPALSG